MASQDPQEQNPAPGTRRLGNPFAPQEPAEAEAPRHHADTEPLQPAAPSPIAPPPQIGAAAVPPERAEPLPGAGGAPFSLDVALAFPAVRTGEEPEDPCFARVRLVPRAEAAIRPRLDVCFVLDASASMHRFVLDPEQRAYWRQRAEQRGEISQGQTDGRRGTVWSGQTLRELQQVVSTPMLSTLRGVWKTLEALDPADTVSVVAFADQSAVIYEDGGVQDRPYRLEPAKQGLTRLGSGVDESGLGRGTRLSGALYHALDRPSANSDAPILHRMILVSDGIIEDKDACRSMLDTAVDRGLVISVIGVGDEFDEEFLMMVADLTRGNYYYAATAPEVERAVTTELEIITRVVGRRAVLRIQPDRTVILRDVYPIAPSMSEFQSVWVEQGGWRFNIGDLSAAQPPEFLLELAPAAHPGGQVRLGAVRIEARGAGDDSRLAADAPVQIFYSDEAMLLRARDDEVVDAVERLEIYREERRAAIATSRGDTEAATRHLQAATRMLRKMGAEDLADEMDAAAGDAASGTRNLGRTKRVKAGTRKLGQAAKSGDKEPAPPSGETRQLR